MEIFATVSFEEMLTLGQSDDLKIAFWENESKPFSSIFAKDDGKIKEIFAILGPEGGLTDQEIESARAKGFITAGLGSRILRAETATIAACVLLQNTFGDMGWSAILMKNIKIQEIIVFDVLHKKSARAAWNRVIQPSK